MYSPYRYYVPLCQYSPRHVTWIIRCWVVRVRNVGRACINRSSGGPGKGAGQLDYTLPLFVDPQVRKLEGGGWSGSLGLSLNPG